MVQLFIRKLPNVVKELISREAVENRRSINQEAIALLEEALVQRVGATGQKRRSVQVLLEDYAARPHPDRVEQFSPMPSNLGTT
jgi:hypothetical protein